MQPWPLLRLVRGQIAEFSLLKSQWGMWIMLVAGRPEASKVASVAVVRAVGESCKLQLGAISFPFSISKINPRSSLPAA